MNQNRVLVVDIDPVIRSGICNFLISRGFDVIEASSYEGAKQQFGKVVPDAAILDLCQPNGDAKQLVKHLRGIKPKLPLLALAGHASYNPSSHMVREEADQVFTKPVELWELHDALVRLLARQKPATSSAVSHRKLPHENVNPFLGTSAPIRGLHEIAKRVLSSESPILLQGETGAGKGVLANWIHRNGPRAEQPFLDLNCAGLSRELLESELFGHEKGAFTSAVVAKQGLLEVSNHGTVFLDEIGDIDLQVQPKLLKVLEDRVFRRLGDVRDRAVDIRLISATHRDLLDLVRQHKFRPDLYFRVNIIFLKVPPLRDRVEDIAVLAQQLLRSIARQCGRAEIHMSNGGLSALERYPWPGNIRELRNVLERASLIAEHDVIKAEHLQFQANLDASFPASDRAARTLKQMECAYISHVLHDEGGSVERAARRLGIPRSSLYNKMKRFEIPQGTGRL